MTRLSWLSLGGNRIANLTPLARLTGLAWLNLENNRVADISPLVRNTGLGSGDLVDFRGNPLNSASRGTHTGALWDRGVDVRAGNNRVAARVCANGAPGAADPRCRPGRRAIAGIDRIPLDRVKATNRELQSEWALAEVDGPSHARSVGVIACQAYVTDSRKCTRDDRTGKHRESDGTVTSRTGAPPFTELLDERFGSGELPDNSWFKQEATSLRAKIVTYTAGGGAAADITEAGTLPYLIVQSNGNHQTNESWYDFQPPENKEIIDAAIAADKLLLVAGWGRDANGNYVRHRESGSCNAANSELDNGCLWARYSFGGLGSGTSYSAPQVSAALASVLAVFPDTTPRNLARLAKACARRTGDGIETLLEVSGGLGVADFTCMAPVVHALANLPAGGRADVTINGRVVSVGQRDLVLAD